MKILVFGDSIGYGKWDSEGGRVARLRKWVDAIYNLGVRSENAQVYNCCIPGETALRMQYRFSQELDMKSVERNKDMPIIVIFAIGINDSCLDPWIQQGQTPIEEFKKAIHTMISYCQQRKYEVIVIGLTPVDESKVGTLFKNSTIQMYDAVLRTISQKESVKYIHVFDRFINQGLTDHLYDGLHPDTLGHQKLFEHFTHAMKDLSITFK